MYTHLECLWVDEPLCVDRPLPLQQVNQCFFVNVHPCLKRRCMQLCRAQQAVAIQVKFGKNGGQGPISQHSLFVNGGGDKGRIVQAPTLAQVEAAAQFLYLVAIELHSRLTQRCFHVSIRNTAAAVLVQTGKPDDKTHGGAHVEGVYMCTSEG